MSLLKRVSSGGFSRELADQEQKGRASLEDFDQESVQVKIINKVKDRGIVVQSHLYLSNSL